MQKISLQKAKEEIKNLFIEKGVKFKNDNQNDEKSTSFISNNTFFIDKRQMEREDVTAMLVNYFIGKQVENGGCILSPMTLLWTTIELYDKDNPRKTK